MNIKIRSIEIDKAITTFVAINLNDGSIVGKCSLKIRGNKTLRYQDAEVIRRYRGNGIYKKLFLARERFIKRNKLDNYRIESYCKKSTLNLFLKHGFTIKEELFLVKKSNSKKEILKVV